MEPPDLNQPQEPAEAAPLPPSFCTRCGDSLTQGIACLRCQTRDSQPTLAVEAPSAPLKAALWLYFSLLGVCVLSYVVLEVLDKGDSVPGQLAFDGIFAAVVIAACIVGWKHIVPGLKNVSKPLWYVIAFASSIVTFLLAHTIVTLVERMGATGSYRYTENFTDQGYPFSVCVVSICVCPAIFEELAFRGFIQSSMMRVMEVRDAVLVTALMFAILHLSPIGMVHLAIIGLVLGVLRVRTGSLYPGMLMHFCHNFWVIAAEKWWT
jgi:membrane protease YdiL (CAAX protease family)